jgi:hypothetical protein
MAPALKVPDPVELQKLNTQLVTLSEADPVNEMAPPFPAKAKFHVQSVNSLSSDVLVNLTFSHSTSVFKHLLAKQS